jgi:hypothetical protein
LFRLSPIAAFAAAALFAACTDSDAAFADLRTLPPEQQQTTAYLTVGTVAPEHREKLTRVLFFVVPSLSSKPYLGDQLPYRVPHSNLLRLDLAGLGWQKTYSGVIAKHYVPKYRPDLHATHQVPLVVSGLWFASNLTDSVETADAQYQLLYGGTPPANEKDFKKFWKVNDDNALNFARLEGQSGVAVQKGRVLENQPTANRGYHWQTYDSRVVAGKTDALENLTARPPKHDATELIAAIPKHVAGKAGTLQAYFLANDKGQRQEKAPSDIVVDTTGTRGVEIRNTLSCIACHTDGIRKPSVDQYREFITSGARVYTPDKDTAREIDRYLDSPIAGEIDRNNADYTAGVSMCNGLTPADNARAFSDIVRLFDAPLSLDQAARELYMAADQWRLALGDYSRTQKLSARLAALAQGQPITRQQWENNFQLAQQVAYAWSQH